MTNYTPGPWTVEEYGDDDCPALVIHRDSEHRVCFMATPGSHGDPKRIAADARLIAAAPDLLRLANAINLYFADYDCPLRSEARAAIAKATGSAE